MLKSVAALFALFLLTLALPVCAQQFGPTSLAAESANNTSASSSFGGLTDFRTADANTSPALGGAIITNPFEITPVNISQIDPGAPRGGFGDVHTLVYSGFNGKIFVETQTWYCDDASDGHLGTITRNYSANNSHTFNICNQHQITGYNSNDASHAQANAAVDDMAARGFDGFIADSSGDPNGCGYPNFTTSCTTLYGSATATIDGAINAMRNRINSNYASTMQYGIMEDQNAFAGDCQTSLGANQPQCIEAKIIHDINYYHSTRTYFSDSTYVKIGGVPVLLFFDDEIDAPFSFSQCTTTNVCNLLNGATCTGNLDCWNKIWDGVANQGVALKMVFRNTGGFTHRDTSGGFAWVTPDPTTGNGSITATTQENWDDDNTGAAHPINVSPTNSNYLGTLYHTAECIYNGGCTGLTAFAIAFKGFDREDAGFVTAASQGKVISQLCGQTWLNTFAKINGPDDKISNQPYFSSSHQLPFIQVATWDDYDEGSEIQTGIGNCVNEASFSIGQPDHTTALSFDYNFSDTTNGTLATVDRYRLFFTTHTDGTNLFGFDVFPSCTNTSGAVTCSGVNLNSLQTWQAGTYRIYIKAMGKPSITNHMFQDAFATFTPSTVNTPANLNFGTVQVGTSSTQTINVTITGSFDVTINSLSISQSGSVFQLLTSPGCVMNSTNTTCQISIKYTPVNTAGDTGTLVIGHNGANGSNTVPLSGNGGTGGCTTTTTVSGVDDKSGWTHTQGSATTSLTQNVASPSLDGASAQFKLTGGVGYTNAKWEVLLGPNDSATEFQLDLQVQVDQPTNVQQLEFGVSQMIGGSDYAFHFACDIKNTGVWKVWNAALNTWSTTSIGCGASTFPAGTWVHLVFDAQRTTGNQLQYNWLQINGTQSNINQTFNPNTESPDNVEASINLYGDKNNDPYTVTVDSMTVKEIATCP